LWGGIRVDYDEKAGVRKAMPVNGRFQPMSGVAERASRVSVVRRLRIEWFRPRRRYEPGKLFEFCNERSLWAVQRPVLVSPPMLRARRWLAGLMVVVFAAVEIFASAPQLHLHQGEARATAHRQRQVFSAQSSRSTKPSDCIICRTSSIPRTLAMPAAVAPPADQQALGLAAPVLSHASEFLDDARGRAPPAC
jgi:hypothetical protein